MASAEENLSSGSYAGTEGILPEVVEEPFLGTIDIILLTLVCASAIYYLFFRNKSQSSSDFAYANGKPTNFQLASTAVSESFSDSGFISKMKNGVSLTSFFVV